MAYSTLPESGLRYADIGHATWNADVNNYNISRLHNTLLKLSALLDVDATGLADQDALTYNSSTQKWEPRRVPGGFIVVTSTTTTTTTTTTV